MTENQIWSPSAAAPVEGRDLRLFALNGTDELGRDISKLLAHPLSAHEERDFEDGEHKARPLDAVAGADVYVIQSLHGGPRQSANDKLCRLLFFIGALKDAGARRVTAVAPYLCYARKDRRTKANDPVTTRYVAALFEAIGCDAVVTLEVHNEAAFENAFRCRAVALTAAPLMIDRIKAIAGGRTALRHLAGSGRRQAGGPAARGTGSGDGPSDRQGVCRKAPQRGGGFGRPVRRRRRWGHLHHRRRSHQHGRHAGAGGAGRARAWRPAGVRAALPMGCSCRGPKRRLPIRPSTHRRHRRRAGFRLPAGPVRDKLDIVPAAPLLAEAIRRLHEDKALTDLLVF